MRIATFNCSLNRPAQGQLQRDLSTPDDRQARAVAEIIQRVNPDILLLPSKGMRVCGGGVFWPARSDATAALCGETPRRRARITASSGSTSA